MRSKPISPNHAPHRANRGTEPWKESRGQATTFGRASLGASRRRAVVLSRRSSGLGVRGPRLVPASWSGELGGLFHPLVEHVAEEGEFAEEGVAVGVGVLQAPGALEAGVPAGLETTFEVVERVLAFG